MEYDVTIDRDKYLGGSDMPIIFGISPFKTRWQLLLEKAEPETHTNSFSTPATEYGHTMEPKIRDYINENWGTNYEPDQRIKDDLRANVDGWEPWEDGKGSILEVKTTSHIKGSLDGYKHYLVQLLFYMMMYNADNGVLAVYERPEDFDEEFDRERLEIYSIDIKYYANLCEEIKSQIERFRVDLERVKENPLLTEQDLQPKEVVEAANWVLALEQTLLYYKEVDAQAKLAKQKLKEAMDKHGITKWMTDSGMKIANVADGADSVVKEFDFEKFASEHPKLAEKYQMEKVKKGRKGYLRITLPKWETEETDI